MNIEYPRAIKVDLFGGAWVPVTRDRAPRGLHVARSAQNLQQRNSVNTLTCSLDALSLQVVGGPQTATSYTAAHPPIGPNDPRVWFAPTHETTEIHWTIAHPERVTELTIEILCVGRGAPIWRKTLTWTAGACPASSHTPFDGSIDTPTVPVQEPSGAAAVVARLDGGLLPSGYLDVRRSPYQVVAKITGTVPGARATVPRRWVYVDVLVASVTLAWGDRRWRAARLSGVSQANSWAATNSDNALFQRVINMTPAPTAGHVYELALPSNLFAKKANAGIMGLAEASDTTDFDVYKDLWGDGPRIALRAEVKVLHSDGVTAVLAPRALGGARVLWDWDDDQPDRWQTWRTDTEKQLTEDFLDDDVFALNRAHQPRSANCPVELGGKLGAPNAPVFPSGAVTTLAGVTVTPCPTRTWAAFSTFGAGGDGSRSAVVFNPARMAGDRYRVRAWVEVSDEMDCTTALAGPARLNAEAGVFVVRRQVDVHYATLPNSQLGVTPAALQTALEQEFLDTTDIKVAFHPHNISLPVYGQSVRAAVDERIADPAQRARYPAGHLFFEFALDLAPASHPAVINYRPRNQYEQDLRNALRDNHVLRVTLPPGVITERIESGNKRGDVLWNSSLATAHPGKAFVLMHSASAADFASGDQVRGLQTNVNGAIQVDAAPSCWGYSIMERRVSVARPSLKDGVEVSINGTVVPVAFSRTLGRLGTVLPQNAADGLRNSVVQVASNLAPGRNLQLVVVARETKSKRVQERVDAVKAFLEKLFTDAEVIDRQVFWDERKNWTFGANYSLTVLRSGVTNLLQGSIVQHCAEAVLAPTDRGVLVVHFEGTTNLAQRPEYLTTVFREGRCAGAYDGSVWPAMRDRGVVGFSTADPALPTTSPDARKDLDVVLVHETGHALFLPHAIRRRPTSEAGENEEPGLHVLHDNCLMNYELDSKHFCGLCILRLRGWKWDAFRHKAHVDYEYQIELTLDEPGDLFLSPENAPRGRRERLDLLGLINRPLNHPEAIPAGVYGWKHARAVVPGIDNAGALDDAVKNFLVEGGALPAPGNAARMFIPTRTALYTRSKYFELTLGAGGANLANYEIAKFSLGANPFDADAAFYAGNAALGRIPLKVKVRHRVKGSNTPWHLADDSPYVTVVLQLLAPDDLPTPPMPAPAPSAALGGTAYFAGPVAPALGPAADQWMQEKVVRDQPDRDPNPQQKNVHHSRGGLRGAVLEVFRKGRNDNFAALPPHARPHAQCVTTDMGGEAHVVFQPSRIGGDRYRIRAFVGAPTLPDEDGRTPAPHVVDTGTLVRWRVARVSKHLYMPTAGNPAPWRADLAGRTCTCNRLLASNPRGVVCDTCIDRFGDAAPVDLRLVAMELARAHLLLVLEPDAVNPQHLRTVKDDFIDRLKDVLNDVPDLGGPAQCGAVSVTRNAMQADAALPTDAPNTRALRWTNNGPLVLPGTLTIRPNGGGPADAFFECDGANWNATRNAMPEMSIAYTPGTGTVRVLVPATYGGGLQVVGQFDAMHGFFDIDALLSNVFPDASPAIFNFALPPGYNAARVTGQPMPVDNDTEGMLAPVGARTFIDAREDGGFTKVTMLLTLARSIDDNNGYLPGIAVVQGAAFDNYFLVWPSGTQEGKGASNLVLLCKPNATTSLQGIALHEVCHTLMLQHAPDASNNKPDLHDANDPCAMSYSGHDGDLCGQCIAALRGLNAFDPHFVTQVRPPPQQPVNQPPPQRKRFGLF